LAAVIKCACGRVVGGADGRPGSAEMAERAAAEAWGAP